MYLIVKPTDEAFDRIRDAIESGDGASPRTPVGCELCGVIAAGSLVHDRFLTYHGLNGTHLRMDTLFRTLEYQGGKSDLGKEPFIARFSRDITSGNILHLDGGTL